jgi:DNA-binding transcriptional ArsR family regulator
MTRSARNSLRQETQLDVVFNALSDSTRRKMLSSLMRGSKTVTELAEPFDISLPAISKHLKVLESARLVERTIEGRVHHCRISAKPLEDAEKWLSHYRTFWEGNLDALKEYIEKSDKE